MPYDPHVALDCWWVWLMICVCSELDHDRIVVGTVAVLGAVSRGLVL